MQYIFICFIFVMNKNKDIMSIQLLIKQYEVLEAKQENGTITMEEDAQRNALYERMNNLLFS